MLVAALTPPVAQWLTAILIARLAGVTDLGSYVLANAIATPVVLIMQLPLRSVYVVHQNPELQFDIFLALRIAMLCAAMLLTLTIGALVGAEVVAFGVVAALALARCAESTSDMLYAPLHRRARLSFIAKLTVWRTAQGLAASSAVLSFTGSIFLCAAALAVSNCVAIVVWEWPTRRLLHLRGQHPFDQISVLACYQLAKQAAPLSIVQTLTALAGNTPRYVVQWGAGSSALGFYAVLEHFSALAAVACNAMGQTFAAGMARDWHANKKEDFVRRARDLLISNALAALAVFVLAVAAGNEIVSFIYGTAFEPASHWLVLMSICGLFTAIASAGGYILTSVGIHKEQIPIMAMSLVASAGAGCFAVLWLGYAGAIIGVMIGAVVQIVLTLIIMRRALSLEAEVRHA
jgi:O-antigen/teichoic acid export membrane protein